MEGSECFDWLYAVNNSYVCVTGTKLALKYVSKNKTKLRSFLREYSLTAALGCSPFIIKALDVLFETEESYVFGQEYAPAGDLFDIIPPQVQHTDDVITMITAVIFNAVESSWFLLSLMS